MDGGRGVFPSFEEDPAKKQTPAEPREIHEDERREFLRRVAANKNGQKGDIVRGR